MSRSLRAVFWAASLSCLVAALGETTWARTSDRLAHAIDLILAREVFRPASVAIDIRDLETGRVLYERNPTLNMKPASTMKLFTTAALLDAEGPEALTAPTTIETAGRLDSFGRVLGDIYLIGRGDPNLSDRFESRTEKNPFDQLAKDLKDAGITRIEGRLIAYDGLFSSESIPDSWTADDLVWSYGAEVSALSAFDNTLRLRLEPGEQNEDAARLTIRPATGFMQIENRVKTGEVESKTDIALSRDLGSRQVVLEGRLARSSAAWTGSVAVPEPARFAATLLAEALGRQGIVIRDTVTASRDPLPSSLRPLASVRGPAVIEQIRVVNKESQNLHAETLLRRLGLAAFKDASVEASLRAREAFLKAQGVRIEDTAMYDGSGLSRSDLVTARSLVDLLSAMDRHRYAKAFRDSLPVGGVDGTLRRRMTGTTAQGRIYAKTGSLRHVNALAGYVDAVSGRRLVFSILVNHHTRPSKEALEAMDAICVLLADLRS